MSKSVRTSPSLGQRAVYAVLLMAGFYILAIVIAGLLLYLPYAEWRYLGRVDIKLAFFSIGAACAIIIAVLPRIDKFEPPGPELAAQQHPHLFQLISEVAEATGQAPPAHVYLVPDLNAWVAQRGGIMGFGGERVMGVGLPLLQVLSVAEFRAVLAHECGHFHGGDTMLGPWVYKTRSAIDRTLAAFTERHTWLGKPFEWYGTLFLRITHAVSRHQEYAADALAARVAGAAHLATGLRSIHAYAPLFPSYWRNEVAPALQAGYQPPIASGFGEFLRSPAVADAATSLLQEQLTAPDTNPFDTHPPFVDRLTALHVEVAPNPAPPQEPALVLLSRPESLEAGMLAHLLPKDVSAALQPCQWAELGELAYLPGWREVVANSSSRLAGLRAVDLPALANPRGALAVRLKLAANNEVATDRGIAEAGYIIGAGLAVALRDRGFRFSTAVGLPVTFDIAGTAFRPFDVMESLGDGSLAADAWAALLQKATLGDHLLGDIRQTGPSPSLT